MWSGRKGREVLNLVLRACWRVIGALWLRRSKRYTAAVIVLYIFIGAGLGFMWMTLRPYSITFDYSRAGEKRWRLFFPIADRVSVQYCFLSPTTVARRGKGGASRFVLEVCDGEFEVSLEDSKGEVLWSLNYGGPIEFRKGYEECIVKGIKVPAIAWLVFKVKKPCMEGPKGGGLWIEQNLSPQMQSLVDSVRIVTVVLILIRLVMGVCRCLKLCVRGVRWLPKGRGSGSDPAHTIVGDGGQAARD